MSFLVSNPIFLVESRVLRDYISGKIEGKGVKENVFYLIKSPIGKPMLIRAGKLVKNSYIFDIMILEYGRPFSNLKDTGWYLDKYSLSSTDTLKPDGNIIISSDLARKLLSSLNIKVAKLPETSDKLKVNLKSLDFQVIN